MFLSKRSVNQSLTQHHMHLWTSTVLKSTISHPVIPVLAEYCRFGHFANKSQISTYFATNCYLFCRHNAAVASRYRLCQLLCWQIRLKPREGGGGGGLETPSIEKYLPILLTLILYKEPCFPCLLRILSSFIAEATQTPFQIWHNTVPGS